MSIHIYIYKDIYLIFCEMGDDHTREMRLTTEIDDRWTSQQHDACATARARTTGHAQVHHDTADSRSYKATKSDTSKAKAAQPQIEAVDRVDLGWCTPRNMWLCGMTIQFPCQAIRLSNGKWAKAPKASGLHARWVRRDTEWVGMVLSR